MRTTSRRTRPQRRSALLASVVASVVVVTMAAASCTSDTDSSSEVAEPIETGQITPPSTANGAGSGGVTGGSDGADGGTLEVRPVVASGSGSGLEPGASAGDEVPMTRDGESFVVGPAQGSNVFSSAIVTDIQGPGLSLTLDGPTGVDVFNALAQQCFNKLPTCPTGRIAIVFDGVILSAPAVNAPSFAGEVAVSGVFTVAEAQELADAINAAAQ